MTTSTSIQNRIISLGTTPETARELHDGILAAGMVVGNSGRTLLYEMEPELIACNETSAELIVKSVEELGHKDGTDVLTITRSAEQLGFDLCPVKVGPKLRVEYTDQPKGEWLYIGMKPFVDTVDHSHIFVVGINNFDEKTRWLDATQCDPDYIFPPEALFVFCVRMN